MQPVGMIGIGLLGSAMAERLLGAGFDVVGFDVDPGRREQLTKASGTSTSSAADVAGQCRRVILSLPNSDIAGAVVDEVASRLQAGSIVIDTTTGDPAAMQALGTRLAKQCVAYLDSTVAGSSQQARAGDVVLMVGGDAQAFESCRDIYDALAKETVHVGPCGSGARMKLVVNLVLGLNRAVLAEGLALARAFDLELSAVLQLLKSTVAYSRVMDVKGEKMVSGDFSAAARLSQHLKDVRLILANASSAELELPLSQLHSEMLASLEAAGHGDEDNSAVFKFYE